MAKSNAQRQAEWRRRRAARASGQAVPQMVSAAVDDAVLALWTFFNRPSPAGEAWADIENVDSLSTYREIMRQRGDLVKNCRIFTTFSGFKPDEREALQRVVAIADALAMNQIEPQ